MDLIPVSDIPEELITGRPFRTQPAWIELVRERLTLKRAIDAGHNQLAAIALSGRSSGEDVDRIAQRIEELQRAHDAAGDAMDAYRRAHKNDEE